MSGDENPPSRLSFEEEVVRLAPDDDPNGRRMLRELFGELPATHPDSPYAGQGRALQRDSEGWRIGFADFAT